MHVVNRRHRNIREEGEITFNGSGLRSSRRLASQQPVLPPYEKMDVDHDKEDASGNEISSTYNQGWNSLQYQMFYYRNYNVGMCNRNTRHICYQVCEIFFGSWDLSYR